MDEISNAKGEGIGRPSPAEVNTIKRNMAEEILQMEQDRLNSSEPVEKPTSEPTTLDIPNPYIESKSGAGLPESEIRGESKRD